MGSLFVGLGIFTTVGATTIDLPQYGFTMEALDGPPSATAPTTALMTFLPVSDGFAPNINVNIQPYSENITSYIAMSKDQFKKMNWVILAEKQNGETECILEYTGLMKGKDLHFYARAIANSGKVYLVTAAAKESQWNTVSEILRRNVDGFKLK